MRFYIDYDDCLCETARAFVEIAARLFGKHVPYEKVRFFNNIWFKCRIFESLFTSMPLCVIIIK